MRCRAGSAAGLQWWIAAAARALYTQHCLPPPLTSPPPAHQVFATRAEAREVELADAAQRQADGEQDDLAKGPLDQSSRWAQAAEQMYAADGDLTGWDSDGEAQESAEERYLKVRGGGGARRGAWLRVCRAAPGALRRARMRWGRWWRAQCCGTRLAAAEPARDMPACRSTRTCPLWSGWRTFGSWASC